MRPTNPRLGLTIIEMTLVLSLVVSLLVLVAVFLTKGQRYAAATHAYAAVQSEANLLLNRVTNELYHCSRHHLKVGPSVDEIAALSFAPVKPDAVTEFPVEFEASTGKIFWKKWVAFYYQSSTKQVLRVELPLDAELIDLAQSEANPELYPPPSPTADFAYFRSLGTARPLGSKVESFEVSVAPGGNASLVKVKLTVGDRLPVPGLQEGQKNVSVTTEMMMSLIN